MSSDNPLTDQEFAELVRLAKKVLWSDRDTRRKLEAQKLHITPANFYATIPSVSDYENSFEFREPEKTEGSYNSPTVFDTERTRQFLSQLKAYAAEFNPPLDKDPNIDKMHYHWNNSSFSYMDAMSYYCVLRHFKPDRVVEVGAGNSTLVADLAIKKNGHGEIVIIEPFPLDFLSEIDSVSEIIQSGIQDVGFEALRTLIESAQVFFIDSTHTVKVGSDCLYIYLKLLPAIRKRLIVHAHDIALPYALPINRLDRHVYWTEQYLLYAYLLDNPKTKVLTSSIYIQRQMSELSKALMHDRYGDGGGSIWFEYNGNPEPEGSAISRFFRSIFGAGQSRVRKFN